MAKAATKTVKAANVFKQAPLPEVTHVTPDYADIASRLVSAYDGSNKAAQAATQEYESKLSIARTSAIDGIRAVASEYPGMSGEDFDTHVKGEVTELLTAAEYKAIPTRVAMIKVAFVALSNGIEPQSDKAQANLQHFVNDEARAACQEQGLIAESKKGRKSGSTSEKTKDQRELACLLLAGSPDLDKELVQKRAALLHWATSPGNWKLLEAKLNDMARVLKKA